MKKACINCGCIFTHGRECPKCGKRAYNYVNGKQGDSSEKIEPIKCSRCGSSNVIVTASQEKQSRSFIWNVFMYAITLGTWLIWALSRRDKIKYVQIRTCQDCGNIERVKPSMKLKGWQIAIIVVLWLLLFGIIIGSSGDAETGQSSISNGETAQSKYALAEVKISSYETVKDDDDTYLVVVYDFTNRHSSATSFSVSCNVKVWQNGVECRSGHLRGISDDYPELINVQPDATFSVKQVYKLYDDSSEVTIEVSDILGITEYLKRKIEL